MADPKDIPENMIDVGSGCSPAGRPFVQIHWQDKGAQIGIDEARDLADNLLQAAASAEADAMLLRFFRSMDFPERAWEAMVVEWREYVQGEKNREKES